MVVGESGVWGVQCPPRARWGEWMNEVVGVVQATHLVCVRVTITMYEYGST